MSFLIAPLTIACLSAVLAALIAVIDRIVNNYGECQIDINNGTKVLTVKGGEPLLSLLSSEGIYLPSACGGKGSCGACKCQVETDIGPHLPTETPYLTKEEIKDKIRLSCQVKVKSDLSINIPEELFNVKQFDATVVSIKDVTYDIKEVVFDLGDETITFHSGMYIQIVVPPYDKIKGTTQRAYSMSSRPLDHNRVELLIRLVPGGIATTYVHEHLKEGDKMGLVGPFGDFRRSSTDSIMLCVAGGSGMAPFKSILHDMIDSNITHRDVWYFFGARSLRDMFYMDEMYAMAKENPWFHFVPALSEPQPEDNWTGETGLITDVLDRFIKNTIGADKDMEGYLCGSPGMINACNNVMTGNGIPLEKIYYDSFA
ncbi:2Fe-2S iron-sulfur cluster binding domain-containing protein [Oceanispirochaeta crateris]|uniref:2Fe-2S iron-sulfur cluster binding domain-containing protein n=1 Tax=Oceanispirochaeta crateris TaxID=2518645 RepID=A0A5C1QLM3_9SPIO|nr:2Fe-2S iron-sulfur cluster binding domain-containing protein [Oceanispirochaeta crateris]QEN07436.1 2Fe-2S iron-sulfur cluster binding domain-containing protein [Oceanispirochaeta crateris]